MHTWARRGLQTALVTGGLMMLGTGIASAHENVNPDRPATGLDGQVSVPLDIHDNQVGTPFGQVNLPDYHHTITTPDVGGQMSKASQSLPKPLAKPAQQVTDRMSQGAGTVTGTVGKAVNSAQDMAGKSALPTDKLPTGALPVAQQHNAQPHADARSTDPTRGNTITGDIVAPVEISGNALALGGPAHAQSTSDQHYADPNPVRTEGNGPISGNVLGLDWAAPVQVTGNALALGSTAAAQSSSDQSATTGGDVTTTGAGQFLAGNVLMGQLATPLQVNGNALAGGGAAAAQSEADSAATSDGSLRSNGNGGVLSGNVGGGPLALPVSLSGNGLSGPLGEAAAVAETDSYAEAGSEDRTGRSGVPTYIDTTGNHSILSGTAATLTGAGPAEGNGNAGTLLGESAARGSSASEAAAGGFLSSYGKHALGSGTIVNPNLAVPGDVVSNAVAGGGAAEASSTNTVDSTAGHGSYTNGKGSVLSASNLAAPVAYPLEAFGNAGALAGEAAADPTNDIAAQAGGYNGTIGNDSLLTANEVETPLAGALEAFGDSAAGPLGTATSGATETKDVKSNGGGNTNDDNGVISSNLAQVAGSLPLQAFGDAVSAGGAATSTAEGTSDFHGGGLTKASGKGGFVAGNIASVPVSLPGQAFGDAASVLGVGSAAARNDTSSTAGGYALTNGEDGTIAGNVASVPVAGVGQLFGDAVSVVGNDAANADNQTSSTAGGPVTTNGDNGTLAGDVASAQLLPVLQAFGDTLGVVGNDQAGGENDTVATSGGDITTSGVDGAFSGDILDFPAAFVGQAFGDGAGVLSNGVAHGDNTLVGTVGGEDTSAGDESRGSGIVSQHPFDFGGQIYDVALPVFSNILTSASNDSAVTVADEPARHIFPFDGGNLSGLPATSMPKLPNLAQLPVGTPIVTQETSGMRAAHAQQAGLDGLPAVADMPQLNLADDLDVPNADALRHVTGAAKLGELPGLSGELGGRAPHARSVSPLDGPVVPGANNLDLNLGDLFDLGGMLPKQGEVANPAVSTPGLSGLDTASLQQAFAELQDKAGNLGQQVDGLHSADQSLTSFTGDLPLN